MCQHYHNCFPVSAQVTRTFFVCTCKQSTQPIVPGALGCYKPVLQGDTPYIRTPYTCKRR